MMLTMMTMEKKAGIITMNFIGGFSISSAFEGCPFVGLHKGVVTVSVSYGLIIE